MHENARIVIIAALVGATSWLDIIQLGDDSAPVVPAGGTIEGAVSAGLLADVLGPDAPEMVADAKEFLALLGRVPDDYDAYIIPVLDDIRNVVDDAAENRYPSWAESVDRVMTWAESMTGRVEAIVDESHGSVKDVRSMIADNRPKVDRTLDNIEQSSAKVGDITAKVESFTDDALVISDDIKAISADARERAPEIMATAERVLGRGQDAIDEAVALMGRVQQDYEGWSSDFNESLGNAALASQQIKLATIEIRRSPWKILYRPSSDELDHELLYEAARSFALGVTDLKTATLATERLLNEHGDRLLNDEQSMKRVRDNLLNSLDRYERAQTQLFDILLDSSPTK
ncbi:MAG: hypothetical protein KC983_02730 [Phycisphaerales bacterium]|nr:hypothetical protein [Phycisphaerales bacterium]